MTVTVTVTVAQESLFLFQQLDLSSAIGTKRGKLLSNLERFRVEKV